MKNISILILAILLIGGCLEPTTGKSNPQVPAGSTGNGTSNSVSTNSAAVPPKLEYIIFGRFCGRCRSGKCAPMFKLDLVKKELSVDNSSHYTQGEPLVFEQKLADTEYKLASGISTKLPDSLFITTENRFGCPNCADQCGIYLEIKSTEKKYSFELDNNLYSMSGFAKTITEQLQEIINKLQETIK